MSLLKKLIATVIVSFVLTTSLFAGTADASGVNANQLVASAKSVMGVKYRSGGTTTAGFDCSGYITYVFKKQGISLPRTSGGMYATGKSVSKANLQVGDLVFFNTSGKGVSHAGIYIGNGKFAHSASSKGVSIASINDPYYWGKRYVGAKRVATVTVAKK